MNGYDCNVTTLTRNEKKENELSTVGSLFITNNLKPSDTCWIYSSVNGAVLI